MLNLFYSFFASGFIFLFVYLLLRFVPKFKKDLTVLAPVADMDDNEDADINEVKTPKIPWYEKYPKVAKLANNYYFRIFMGILIGVNLYRIFANVIAK